MGKMKSKKKAGFSRKQLQQIARRARLLRKYDIAEKSSGVVSFVETEGGIVVPVIKVEGVGGLAKTDKRERHFQLVKRYVSPIEKPKHTIASIITEATRQSVIEGLGIKMLDVKAKPEIAHAMGSLVAARAICMAREIGATGRIAGGGSDVIGAIGRASLDLEINASGTVTTKVSAKPTTKRKSRKKKAGTASTSEQTSASQSETEVVAAPAGGGGGDDNNGTVTTTANQHIVIRDQNGVTHIHIAKLQIFITNQLVGQLNVNPLQVINQLQTQFTGLKDAIEANAVEYKVVEEPKQIEAAPQEQQDDKEDKKETKEKENDPNG